MAETNQPANAELKDDRRQHGRLDRRSLMRYQPMVDIANHGDMKQAELCDFSGGGIRFLAPEPLIKNEQFIIELHFYGWKEIDDEWIRTGNDKDVGYLKAIGAVMWCSEKNETPGTYEIGLRFTGRVHK